MSRSIVRRLAAALALATVLGSALPAMAAPSRSQSSRIPVVFETGFFDQVLSWLGNLLPGQEPKPRSVREKTGITLGGATNDAQGIPNEADRGAMIDPNGLR